MDSGTISRMTFFGSAAEAWDALLILLIASVLRHARAGRVQFGNQLVTAGQLDLLLLFLGFVQCAVQQALGLSSARFSRSVNAWTLGSF